MDIWVIIILGTATAFNLAIVKWKIEHDRGTDAFIDGSILIILAWVFGGTVSGLAIASVTSFIISLYLIVSPPNFEW